MGTIIYKPHCKECGAIIDEDVIYRRLKQIIENRYIYPYNFIEIEPNRCERCGTRFETIEVPMPQEKEG